MTIVRCIICGALATARCRALLDPKLPEFGRCLQAVCEQHVTRGKRVHCPAHALDPQQSAEQSR